MQIEKSTVKESFNNMQERKGSSQTFPIPGELSRNWEEKTITLKDLYYMNPQLYVGYRINENSKKIDGDSGHLTLMLWRTTFDSRAKNMAQALRVFRDMNLSIHPQIVKDLREINRDLALIGKLPQENDTPYTPLILLNDNGILPYTTGQVIDGNRRILALFESLINAEIQEDLPIPVLVGNIPNTSSLAYNAVAAGLDNKPLDERLLLLGERATLSKDDYSNTNPIILT